MSSRLELTNLNYSELLHRYPRLEVCAEQILTALNLMITSYRNQGKTITFGNGGSSADAEHFCGELVKNFVLPRTLNSEDRQRIDLVDPELSRYIHQSLPAISLGVQHSTISAYSNDIDPDYVFAQMLWGLSQPQDVAFAISTSGNSKNVVHALKIAKAKNLVSIALTGMKPSKAEALATVTIKVPETTTHKVQELHLPIYHAICLELENFFFG